MALISCCVFPDRRAFRVDEFKDERFTLLTRAAACMFLKFERRFEFMIGSWVTIVGVPVGEGLLMSSSG